MGIFLVKLKTIIPFTGNDGFFIFYEVALLSLSTSAY